MLLFFHCQQQKKNQYEQPLFMPKKNMPVKEEYADMSLGVTGRELPPVPDERKYVNVDMYEVLGAAGSQEMEPLVNETYVQPEISPRKN